MLIWIFLLRSPGVCFRIKISRDYQLIPVSRYAPSQRIEILHEIVESRIRRRVVIVYAALAPFYPDEVISFAHLLDIFRSVADFNRRVHFQICYPATFRYHLFVRFRDTQSTSTPASAPISHGGLAPVRVTLQDFKFQHWIGGRGNRRLSALGGRPAPFPLTLAYSWRHPKCPPPPRFLEGRLPPPGSRFSCLGHACSLGSADCPFSSPPSAFSEGVLEGHALCHLSNMRHFWIPQNGAPLLHTFGIVFFYLLPCIRWRGGRNPSTCSTYLCLSSPGCYSCSGQPSRISFAPFSGHFLWNSESRHLGASVTGPKFSHLSGGFLFGPSHL
jgi:hypothetical protein